MATRRKAQVKTRQVETVLVELPVSTLERMLLDKVRDVLREERIKENVMLTRANDQFQRVERLMAHIGNRLERLESLEFSNLAEVAAGDDR